MMVTPVGYGVLFLLLNFVAAQSPTLLTGVTAQAIQQSVRLYFSGVDSSNAIVLALLIIQGPYFLSIFGALTGLRVGREFTRREIESGRFELLLASPYDADEVFRGLIASSLVVTVVQLLVLAAVGLGGAILLLLRLGASFEAQFSQLVFVSFAIPIPATLWAVVVTVIVSLFLQERGAISGIENLANLVGIAPPFIALLLVNFIPSVNVLLLAISTLAISAAGTVVGSVIVDVWFTVERVLSQ